MKAVKHKQGNGDTELIAEYTFRCVAHQHLAVIDSDSKHIKVCGYREKRRCNLLYPISEEPVNRPFYGQLPGIGIEDTNLHDADT